MTLSLIMLCAVHVSERMTFENGNDIEESEVLEDHVESDESCPSIPPTANTFLSLVESLEGYTPTVPSSLTANILMSAGLSSPDPRIVSLVSLAAQKFISDLASDALAHCKMRQSGSNHMKKVNKDKKYVMTTEDLAVALNEKGVAAKKPPYYR